MTPVESFRSKSVAVFGLGGSGLSTARALIAGGAQVSAWDDSDSSRQSAAREHIPLVDLSSASWRDFAALVLSPGVPLTHPKPHWTVEKAKAAHVPVIGDIELFCLERQKRAPHAPFVAITGTNGKTTTTHLIEHLAVLGGDADFYVKRIGLRLEMAQNRTQLDGLGPGSKEEKSSNGQSGLTRNPGRERRTGPAGLFVAIGYAAFGEIVGRHFQSDAVTGENADAVAAQLAGEMGENEPFLIQLDAKQPARELFDHSSGNFNTILFAHWPPGQVDTESRDILSLLQV